MSRNVIGAMRQQGFTLVEIALALGIFAFAIVVIMALFPVGLRSANESRVETIVTQIARTVLSDLRTGPFAAARVATLPLPENPAKSAAPPSSTAVSTVNLADPAGVTKYIAYTADGNPAFTTDNEGRRPVIVNYANGTPSADFLVKVESRLVQTTAPFLAQVTVTVESPAAAPVANRTKYPVVTLMGDTR